MLCVCEKVCGSTFVAFDCVAACVCVCVYVHACVHTPTQLVNHPLSHAPCQKRLIYKKRDLKMISIHMRRSIYM